MHSLVCLAAAFAQDTDAVDDHIAIVKQRMPLRPVLQALEVRFPEIRRRTGLRMSVRVPAADDHPAASGFECAYDVATDEAGAAKYQDDGSGNA